MIVDAMILDGLTKKTFDDLTYMDQGTLLAAFTDKNNKKVYDFLKGNQLGSTSTAIDYWAGPMLPIAHSEYPRMIEALKSSFTSRNMIAEVCERAVDGVLGNELAWIIEGLSDTKATEESLTAWVDKRRIHRLLWTWAVQMVALGRSVIRFVIPAKYRGEDGTLPKVANLDEALSLVHVMSPSPLDCAVITDDYSLDDIGVYAYQFRNQNELELTYIDENKLTVLKILSMGSESEEIRLDLGGLLWHIQGEMDRQMVTDDMIQQQSALNVALTMMQRNTHYSGFVERYGIGIEAYKEDGTAIQPITGPGAINFFQPALAEEQLTDETGAVRVTQRAMPAQYGRFEPSSVEPMKVAADVSESAILSIARQSFVLMADTANTSGRSREVAAGDYLNVENRIAKEIQGAYRQVLEFVLRLSGAMINYGSDTNQYSEARAVVTAKVTAFSPTPDERRANLSDYSGGIISLETAMTRAGIDDTDAELNRIKLDQEEKMKQQEANLQLQNKYSASPPQGNF